MLFHETDSVTLCFCDNSAADCLNARGVLQHISFTQSVGTIIVRNTPKTLSKSCEQNVECNIIIIDYPALEGDTLIIVDENAECSTTPVFNPITISAGIESTFTGTFDSAGSYKMCWCNAAGGHCGTDSVTYTNIGTLIVKILTTPTSTNTICRAGDACIIDFSDSSPGDKIILSIADCSTLNPTNSYSQTDLRNSVTFAMTNLPVAEYKVCFCNGSTDCTNLNHFNHFLSVISYIPRKQGLFECRTDQASCDLTFTTSQYPGAVTTDRAILVATDSCASLESFVDTAIVGKVDVESKKIHFNLPRDNEERQTICWCGTAGRSECPDTLDPVNVANYKFDIGSANILNVTSSASSTTSGIFFMIAVLVCAPL
eukprot:GHVL01001155.1.p1 GENE.GHVL01001155.1~~GHVL01001155.1.p1  ORF type:complete len:372 (+),score=36.65 GHVL01001155.1:964-2079(+)